MADASRLGGDHAFRRQRLDPLDHDRPDHLDGRRRADAAVDPADPRETQFCQLHDPQLRMRAADKQGNLETGGVNGSHDRNIDIAPARPMDCLCRRPLGVRRHAVHVEPEGIGREVRRIVAGGSERLIGGDERKDRGGTLESHRCALDAFDLRRSISGQHFFAQRCLTDLAVEGARSLQGKGTAGLSEADMGNAMGHAVGVSQGRTDQPIQFSDRLSVFLKSRFVRREVNQVDEPLLGRCRAPVAADT